MKWLVTIFIALALLNCGGGSGGDPLTLNYTGTLSGTGCFSFQPVSATVNYTVIIEDLSAGGDVRLTDELGNDWFGFMIDDSSFFVTLPDGDERLSITMHEITAAHAVVEATTTCVSFRCCDTLTGEVAG